jgi:hypothetical protein
MHGFQLTCKAMTSRQAAMKRANRPQSTPLFGR